VLGRRHMAKHFQATIADDAFSFAQDPLSIAAPDTESTYAGWCRRVARSWR
jgi:hypothetical protein